jgi:DNA polymerase-3 subunit delta
MIVKSFNAFKLKPEGNFFLIYGKNEGHKNDIINNLLKNKKEIITYEEKEILDNSENFIEKVLTKSLFEDEKIILIKRVTDKILKIIENLNEKKIEDLTIIINSDNLDKKSKLRSFFEKDKNYICIPVYADNEQTLTKLAYNFLNIQKISISQENLNLVIGKCNGDRSVLQNELNKIENFSKNKKKISSEEIIKLINLSENHSISDLVDNCLAKNEKRTISILNENNFSSEDSILILRTFLNKSKKILGLSEEFNKTKNIELTISSAKPAIFWKDKEIVKKQIFKWNPENIKKLIYELLEIEYLVKKNLNNSVYLITNFILGQISQKSNN